MLEVKPIETWYKNTLFRSRLEARWAVFLTELNIQWEYEYEGYDLDGIWYLPDFYLPYLNGGTFVEVKPRPFNDFEYFKVMELCRITGNPVFLAIGTPNTRFYTVLFSDNDVIQKYFTHFNLHWKAVRENRFWVEASPDDYPIDFTHHPELIIAICKARNYRFKYATNQNH